MNLLHCFVLSLFVLTICFIEGDSLDGIDMKSKLRHDLLNKDKYDKVTSPLRYFNDSDVRKMEVGMTLLVLHVHSLDEINGILTLNGWFFVTWEDPRLQWDSARYEGILSLHLEDKSVWIPDIMIYNNAESMELDHYGNAPLRLFKDGTVYWFPPGTLRSTCPIDHKLYPFDEHECIVNMGVWAYASVEFDIHPVDKLHQLEVVEKYGTENPLWKVLENDLYVKNMSYSCCPDVYYMVVQLKLRLQRRSPFHKYMTTVPSLFAMFLTLAIPWLPPNADVKFILGAIVLFIEVALLLFLGWQIPPGGKSIPTIVLFCGNTFVLSSLVLIVAIVVKKLCRKDTPVPENILSVLRGPAARILCLESQNWEGWVHFIAKIAHRDKLREDEQHLDVGGDSNRVEFSIQDPTQDSKKDAGQPKWYLVAVAIDRVTFVLYCFIFFIMLVASFV